MDKTKDFHISYTIGYNFDESYINKIVKIDKYNQIQSVYSKLKNDCFNYNKKAKNFSLKQLKKHVELCKKNKIYFNYLLDSPCTENKEFISKENYKLMKFLNNLSEIGIKGIILNSPYLCEVIKRKFPNFNITVSEYASIYSLQIIKYWEERGVSNIILTPEINRNFFVLEQILKYTKKTGTNITLIANGSYKHNSPTKIYYNTSTAHLNQKNHKSSKTLFDYNTLNYTYEIIKNPMKFISSNWIRPEDIKYYEETCIKAGNYNLNIKLIDETYATDTLFEILNAYLTKSYNGNILSLLNWPDFINNNNKNNIIKKIKKSFMLKKNKKRYYDFFNKLPEIMIDNKQLNGFIKKFISANECHLKICSYNKNNKENNTCSYCQEWAENIIQFDKSERSNWLKNAEILLNSFYDSSIYN